MEFQTGEEWVGIGHLTDLSCPGPKHPASDRHFPPCSVNRWIEILLAQGHKSPLGIITMARSIIAIERFVEQLDDAPFAGIVGLHDGATKEE
jgi:hypothetical protein